MVDLIVGGAIGLLVGAGAGHLMAGMIGGSMLGIAGAFLGTFVGWIVTLMWPGRPANGEQTADYDDRSPTK